jgi:hypothetical protein
MGFKRDLQLGEKAEEYLVDKLKKEFPTLKQLKKNFSEYDLMDDNGYTIEVKFDRKSKSTGNTAIECEYKGNPSGINCTKAMEWIQIYYLNNQWVYSRIKTYDLRAFVKSNGDYLTTIDGGDNKLSKMILIPVEDFADTFNYESLQ